MANRTVSSSSHKATLPSGKSSRTAHAAIPVLLSMIEHGESGGLTTAARALAKIAPDQAVTELTLRLNSNDSKLRRHSADALGFFKKSAKPAVPTLIQLLQDSDIRVRISGAVALRDIGEEPDLVVPALMAQLSDPEFKVRRIAAIALRSFGKRAKDAVPRIIRIIEENRDPFYRDSLMRALAEIDEEAAKRLARKQARDEARHADAS